MRYKNLFQQLNGSANVLAVIQEFLGVLLPKARISALPAHRPFVLIAKGLQMAHKGSAQSLTDTSALPAKPSTHQHLKLPAPTS